VLDRYLLCWYINSYCLTGGKLGSHEFKAIIVEFFYF